MCPDASPVIVVLAPAAVRVAEADLLQSAEHSHEIVNEGSEGRALA